MFSRTAQSATMPLVRRGGGTSASGVSPGVGGRRSGSRVPALVWGMCRASQTCACSQCGSSVRRAGIDGSAFRVPVVEMWYSVVTSCGDAGRVHQTLWLSVNRNQSSGGLGLRRMMSRRVAVGWLAWVSWPVWIACFQGG